jgi:cation:H+ antiporter
VIVVFVLAMLVGFGGMVLASRRAVTSATDLAAGTQIPPFFVGITLLAIGTDLPEIANSIAASVSGHGDVAIGDAVGSVVTQSTLVLGLLPLLAGTLLIPRRGIGWTGAFTVIGLGMVALLASDGGVSRPDALVLIAVWVVGSAVIYRDTTRNQQLAISERKESRLRLAGTTLAALVVVGLSAMVALWAIIGLAEWLDAPEFLISFFVASVGTSLPELAFDLTAVKRGAVALAIGDVMGSSFVDSTMAAGIGPLIAPTEVSSDLVITAAVAAMVAIAVVTVMLKRIEQHDWRTGTILVGMYLAFFVVLLV